LASAPNGSNGNGAARVNWRAAKAYYLALPEERRSYAAVARRFGVSDVRVGQIAKRDGWAKAVEEIQAIEEREIQRVLRRELRNRAERISRTLEVYDRVSDLALELLPLDESGEIDVTRIRELPSLDALLGKMPGLFRMAELAAGEATDRVAISDVPPVLVAFARIAVLNADADRRGEVMRELEAASAGLVALSAGAEAAA
jgi:hypothetical protein